MKSGSVFIIPTYFEDKAEVVKPHSDAAVFSPD
jgi:hypothetical protein